MSGLGFTSVPSSDPHAISDFEVVEQIGEGGAATVHRARTVLGTEVALKVARASLSEDQRRRFLSECRLQWQVADHPHVVRLYWASAPDDGPAWLATELYEESLSDRLGRDPALSPTERTDVAVGLLRGLAAMHERGVLHRDVKPSNVLLKDGAAALSDFGLAMVCDDWTRDLGAGSRWFAAPEVIAGQSPTTSADVYAAAVTIRALVEDDLAPALDALLTRASSHAPADRPGDAGDFLAQFLDAAPTPAPGPVAAPRRVLPPPAPEPTPTPRPSSRSSARHLAPAGTRSSGRAADPAPHRPGRRRRAASPVPPVRRPGLVAVAAAVLVGLSAVALLLRAVIGGEVEDAAALSAQARPVLDARVPAAAESGGSTDAAESADPQPAEPAQPSGQEARPEPQSEPQSEPRSGRKAGSRPSAPGAAGNQTPPRSAGRPTVRGAFTLVGQDSGRCVTAWPRTVLLNDCDQSTAQQWRSRGKALVNVRNGRCLAVDASRAANAAPVTHRRCADTMMTQRWTFQRDGGVVVAGSRRCLDAPVGVTADNTPLQIYQCDGRGAAPNQSWSARSTHQGSR